MLAVVITDAAFVRREREMLSRLEIGLTGEGVRVVHALPQQLVAEELGALYTTVVGYEAGGLPISRRLRASRLLDTIEETLDLPERKIDIVHAFGLEAWYMGLDLARQSSASVILELWDAGSIAAAAALSNRRVGVRPVEFSVPEPALRRALRKRAHGAHVYVAPWGVHAPSDVPVRSRDGRPLAVAVLTEGRDAAAVRACLAGLSECMKTRGEVMIFAGTSRVKTGRDSAVWAAARELNLLDRLSLVPEIEARREPMTQMDLLLVPEACGTQRTLLLDAMAHGVNIIAAKDELVEMLEHGKTAAIVQQATAVAWQEALARMIDDSPYAASLRSSAHEFVRAERSASGQVAAVITAYNAMVAAAQVGVKM